MMLETDQTNERVLDHVLGWTGGWTRRRMNHRIATDPRIEAEVMDWETTLLPLNGLMPALAPPADTWAAIMAKLNGKGARSALRMRLAWMVPGAACAALLVLIMLPPPTPVYRAELSDTGHTAILATLDIDRHGVVTVVPAVSLPVEEGKSMELWVIPADGTPRSLGLMPEDKRAVLRLGAIVPPATLAVSVEPRGGSPTGSPTGPVIASGPLQPT